MLTFLKLEQDYLSYQWLVKFLHFSNYLRYLKLPQISQIRCVIEATASNFLFDWECKSLSLAFPCPAPFSLIPEFTVTTPPQWWGDATPLWSSVSPPLMLLWVSHSIWVHLKPTFSLQPRITILVLSSQGFTIHFLYY